MRTLVVLTFEVPKPEGVAEILNAIDPTELPYFAGQARIVIDPDAEYVLNYLDGDDA